MLNKLRGVSLVEPPEANISFTLANGNEFSPNGNRRFDRIRFNITSSEIASFNPVYILNQDGKRVMEFGSRRNTRSVLFIWNGSCLPKYCTGVPPDGVYKIEVSIKTKNLNSTNMTNVIVLNKVME